MEIFIISITAFLVAVLTFFSGFGLGTILTPVFMIFFPTNIAIGLTGVVHFFNNVFKLLLVGNKADKTVIFRFGIPAVIAAALGSWLLLNLSDTQPLFSYTLGNKLIAVFPVKFIIALLLIVFACIDLIPYFNRLEFRKEKLPVGGILSGFFGGLAGVQGALSSAFLIKAGLTKEAFIATTVVVSTLVDITRLSIYTTQFHKADLTENLPLVICATLSAILGAYLGNRLLKKVTLQFIKTIVALLLILVSIGLGSGLI
ncbi:sulfite exporter TauE/SafE family protein [Flavobacterium cheonhonense]|uniref:Probable membrane transporter protein n=1 Tax=Flavobacterium cheonhonense TaxID=706185 RepID=A0ABP7TDN6_9FLAO|nr:sulfite exporter TauE/SafE family protein [Flavobacterium cheonhonense]